MKRNHLKWGVVLTYITLFVNIVISILFTPVMLRILGPSEHGLYSTVVSTMSWLTMLGLGIGNSYIKYYSKYKAANQHDKISQLNGTFLIVFSIIGAITFVLGILLSFNLWLIFNENLSTRDFYIARILALIVTVDFSVSFPVSVFTSIISVQEKYIQLKLVNLFRCVAGPLVTLPILLMGYGSIGMLLCTTIIEFIAYAMNIFYCLKKLKAKFVFKIPEKGLFKGIFSFSIFIFANQVINQLNTTFDKILLAKMLNTVSVSIYSIGFSLSSYYSSFASAISSVFSPRIFRIVSENEEDKGKMNRILTEQFARLGRLHLIIQLLMLTGIIFFGQRFIFYWAGENYSNSYWVALVLCISFTIPLSQGIGIEIQTAKNMHKYRTLIYGIMVASNIGLTVLLIPYYSEIGAVVATMIVTVVGDWIIMNVFYQKKLGLNMKYYWKSMLSILRGLIIPAIVGTLMMLFAPMNSIWLLLAWIFLYSIIYCVFMWLFGMNEYEHGLITNSPIGRLTRKIRLRFRQKRGRTE